MPHSTLSQVAIDLTRNRSEKTRELTGPHHDSNGNVLLTKKVAIQSSEIINDVKIVGIHKQQLRKTSFYFIILVVRNDGGKRTVYRKWKEIRELQSDLQKELERDSVLSEPRYYLKKLKHKASMKSLIHGLGTLKRLRVIDSLNIYFQALVYYKNLHNRPIVKSFFAPTDTDLSSSKWCGGGKTYFYVTSSLATRNVEITDCDCSKDMLEVVDEQSSCTLNSEDIDSNIHRFSSSAVSLYDTHQSEPDLSHSRLYDHFHISLPLTPEVYVALDDHVIDGDQEIQNIISLKRNEKVLVLTKSDSGWWFVQRTSESHIFNDEDSTGETGYVPGSFLRKERKLTSSFSQALLPISPKTSKTYERRKSCDSESGSYFYSSQRTESSGSFSTCSSTTLSWSEQETLGEYICSRGHIARDNDELSFSQNSIVTVLQKNEDGWWLARYKNNEGLVPAVYLKKYNDPIKRLVSKFLK